MVAESVSCEDAYIALDPGDTTGWAAFDERGSLLSYGQFYKRNQTEWLTDNISSNLKAVIIEDYTNFGWKQQKKWSKNQTSKNIGAIEMLCELRNVPYFLQPPNIKAIGYKWAGLGEAPTNHSISHQYDAIAHGTYWLRSKGILKPTIPKDG
jgi:hypothetical protein